MNKILAGVVVFLIVYLEPILIFGFKFSLMWKSVFLGFALVVALQQLSISKLVLVSYLYSFKNLFSAGSLSHFFESFMSFVQTSTVPIILSAAATIKYKKISLWEKSNSALSFLTATLAIINIPFLLELLPELSAGIALTALGGEQFGYSGPFQNGHAASVTMASVALVSIYKMNVSIALRFKWFWFAVFLLSLIVIYQSLVRTGMIMFLIGGSAYLFSKHGSVWIIKKMPILLILFSGIAFFIVSNDNLRMRLFDGSIYESSYDHWFYTIGSGRLWMSWTNFVFWFDSGPLAWVIGTGIGPSKDNMELVVGIRVFSHNGFVDALTHNGIVGLLLYIGFFYFSYRYISKYKGVGESFYLGLAMWWAYFFFSAFQGGSRFYFDIMFVFVLLNLSVSGFSKLHMEREFK